MPHRIDMVPILPGGPRDVHHLWVSRSRRGGYVFELTGQFSQGGNMSVLSATAAGVRHHRRWLVRDLDLAVERGRDGRGGRAAGQRADQHGCWRWRAGCGSPPARSATWVRRRSATCRSRDAGTGLHRPRARQGTAGSARPARSGTRARCRCTGSTRTLRGRDLTPYQRQVSGWCWPGCVAGGGGARRGGRWAGPRSRPSCGDCSGSCPGRGSRCWSRRGRWIPRGWTGWCG